MEIKPEVRAIMDVFSSSASGTLTLLNCTIVPPQAPQGEWTVLDLTAEEGRELVKWAAIAAGEGHAHFRSAIGHEATAKAMYALVGQGWVDRTPWDGAGYGLALQLEGRPEEGKILSLEEMEEMGYRLRLVYRRDAGPSVSRRIRDLEDRMDRHAAVLSEILPGLCAVTAERVSRGSIYVGESENDLYQLIKEMVGDVGKEWLPYRLTVSQLREWARRFPAATASGKLEDSGVWVYAREGEVSSAVDLSGDPFLRVVSQGKRELSRSAF